MLFAALLEGYLGYSMVDDLLSGMGLAIGYAVALSIPFIGANVALAIWGHPYPGDADFWSRMYIAHVLIFPLLIGGLLAGAPGAGRLPPPHPVPAEAGQRRAQADRRADVPRPGAALAGADAGGRRRPRPARRPRPDQPDLALGPVPRRRRHQRRPARLVPGLADRGAAADAELRRRRSPTAPWSRTRSGAASSSPSVVLVALLAWPWARAPVHAATAAPTTSSTGRATRRCGPGSAPASSPGW